LALIGPVANYNPAKAQIKADILGKGAGDGFELIVGQVGILGTGKADLTATPVLPVTNAIGGHSLVSE